MRWALRFILWIGLLRSTLTLTKGGRLQDMETAAKRALISPACWIGFDRSVYPSVWRGARCPLDGASCTRPYPASIRECPFKRGVRLSFILAGINARFILRRVKEVDLERRKSFYDSSRLVDAIEYLLDVAEELGDDAGPLPISINISLGTNGDHHYASSPLCRC